MLRRDISVVYGGSIVVKERPSRIFEVLTSAISNSILIHWSLSAKLISFLVFHIQVWCNVLHIAVVIHGPTQAQGNPTNQLWPKTSQMEPNKASFALSCLFRCFVIVTENRHKSLNYLIILIVLLVRVNTDLPLLFYLGFLILGLFLTI